MKRYALIYALLFPLLGFLLSLITLSSYGVNWDSYQHLARGQSYFRYVFYNKTDSNDLPNQCVIPPDQAIIGKGRACNISVTPRISFYEKSPLDVAWANQMTIGHPPLMDIILAGSNRLLYKTLGLVEDLPAYYIAMVAMAFGLAVVVALWSYQTTGLFASIISVLTLYTIPLFFSEQHFNIKDPAVAFLLTLCAYLMWQGIRSSRYIWFLATGIIAGIALGTKFNVVFLAIPIFLWLPFSGIVWSKKIIAKLAISFLSIPVIAWVIFWAGYPAIWNDPITGTLKVIEYYNEVSHTSSNPCFALPFTPQWYTCSNSITPLLFVTTLPIISLLLMGIGFLSVWKHVHIRNGAYLFWFLLLFVPLVRSTLPLVQLYGGSLRQIMEFVGPFSMLAGLGVTTAITKLRNVFPKRVLYLFFLACYIPIIITLIQIHPHQNLFYNSLIGGIKGARDQGFPEVGNTYGNGYKALIDWINVHAEPNARVATLVSVGSSFPTSWLRSDLIFVADDTDMTNVQGDYLLELTVPGMNIENRFRYRYATHLLRPVYEDEFQGVIIGRVWKNDESHRINKYKSIMSNLTPTVLSTSVVDLSLPLHARLSELKMFTQNEQCQYSLTTGVLLAEKEDNTWERFTEGIAYFNPIVSDLTKERRYIFANDTVEKLRLVVLPTSCDLSAITYQLVYHEIREAD